MIKADQRAKGCPSRGGNINTRPQEGVQQRKGFLSAPASRGSHGKE